MTKNTVRIDHGNCDHDATPAARKVCRSIKFDVSGHLRDCVARAAGRAFDNYMVDSPTGPEAMAMGRELLNADGTDCTCMW